MIEHRISRRPGRVGVLVDQVGRTIRDHAPAPVVGAAESLRLYILGDDMKPYDPPGMAAAAYLRFAICGDWDPATPPIYVTGAVTRISVGTYEIADLSGTYTAEAVALLGREAEQPCVYELAAYAQDPATGSVWSSPLSVVQWAAPLRNRADSPRDPATLEPVDLRGPAGPAATVAVGAVTTLPAGSSATVVNAGTVSAAVLNFGIPKGESGLLLSCDYFAPFQESPIRAQVDFNVGRVACVDLTSTGLVYNEIIGHFPGINVGDSFLGLVRFVAHESFEIKVKWFVGGEYAGFKTTISAGSSLTLLMFGFRDSAGNLSLSNLLSV